MTPKTSVREVLLQDLWVHFAGVLVIAFGAADLWFFHSLSHDTALLFIIAGVAGMGLKIANGSTAALRTLALDTAYSASRAAGVAAAAAATVVPGAPPAPRASVLVVPEPPVPSPPPATG